MPEVLPDPSDQLGKLLARITELERQVKSMRSSNPLENATIRRGGITVAGNGRLAFDSGGSILMKDNDGREYMYAGGFATNGFGVTLTRLNGVQALIFSDDDPTGEQVQRIRLLDRNGQTLVSEDTAGDGLAWPLIPFTTYCDDFAQWGGSTDAAFKGVAGAQEYKHSPRIYVRVKHTTDASDTTGELRVTVNGTQIGATTAVGFAIGTTDFGPAAVTGAMKSLVDVRAECRRTAGTGAVRAEIILCMSWPA